MVNSACDGRAATDFLKALGEIFTYTSPLRSESIHGRHKGLSKFRKLVEK